MLFGSTPKVLERMAAFTPGGVHPRQGQWASQMMPGTALGVEEAERVKLKAGTVFLQLLWMDSQALGGLQLAHGPKGAVADG